MSASVHTDFLAIDNGFRLDILICVLYCVILFLEASSSFFIKVRVYTFSFPIFVTLLNGALLSVLFVFNVNFYNYQNIKFKYNSKFKFNLKFMVF